jgi:hypothetical protein
MRVLSLGAGDQSTAVYLLAANDEIASIDYAIFADTGEEPAWVYETVKGLGDYRTPDGRPGAPILVRWLCDESGRQVRLGDQLIDGNEGRFASIPAFIRHPNLYEKGRPAQGKGRRQCTREFKTAVVEATIRRELLGLEKGERFGGPRMTQVFGFDWSEGERIFRVKGRLASGPLSVGEFPLFDLGWRRSDCHAYTKEMLGREVLPSACTFCPLVTDAFRRLVRDRDPDGHRRACDVDARLRLDGSAASKGLDGELYVHRSMVPLSEVDLDADLDQQELPMMVGDCEGLCGH